MLKYGMVGGGKGAFIGDVHRKSIALDQSAVLRAGCFSRNKEVSFESGRELGLDTERVYATFTEMAETEGKRSDGIDFAVITTPNYCHYDACKAFLENNIHVVCEKPLAVSEEQAKELCGLAQEKDLLFAVTFTFAGYPMIRHAKNLVMRGELGKIIMVMGEYPQDYLAGNFDENGLGRIPWRADAAMSGNTNCLGDIGSHIQFTVQYITGLEIDSVCAKLDGIGPAGKLDTNASVMLRYKNGATGMYWSSQVAMGNDNALRLRIYGEKGSIVWSNETPETFTLSLLGHPPMLISKGRHYEEPYGAEGRLPSGHAEGLFGAFANIYVDFCTALTHKIQGNPYEILFPTVFDGYTTMRYIERCLESDRKNQAWVSFDRAEI